MIEEANTWIAFWWLMRGSPLAANGALGQHMIQLGDAGDMDTVETLIEMDLAYDKAMSDKLEREAKSRRV